MGILVMPLILFYMAHFYSFHLIATPFKLRELILNLNEKDSGRKNDIYIFCMRNYKMECKKELSNQADFLSMIKMCLS